MIHHDAYPHLAVRLSLRAIFAADIDRGPYALTDAAGAYTCREYRAPIRGGTWADTYEVARTVAEVLEAIGGEAPHVAIAHTEKVCRQMRGARREAIVERALLDLFHPGRGLRAITEEQYAYATGRTVAEVRAYLDRLHGDALADAAFRAAQDAAHRMVCRSLSCRKCNGGLAFAR